MTNESGGGNRVGVFEALLDQLKGLSLKNVAVLGLLVIVAVPAWFAYLFATDPAFRQEWISSISIRHVDVPCTVYTVGFPGQSRRTDLGYIYDVQGRFAFMILVRGPAELDEDAVKAMCVKAGEHASLLRAALGGNRAETNAGNER